MEPKRTNSKRVPNSKNQFLIPKKTLSKSHWKSQELTKCI